MTRTFVYDTLDRMVLNQEPFVGAWRYVYCDAGAPCQAHHEGYDPESEVGYLFDFGDPVGLEVDRGIVIGAVSSVYAQGGGSTFTGIESATKRFSDASRMRLGGIFGGSLAPFGDRRRW